MKNKNLNYKLTAGLALAAFLVLAPVKVAASDITPNNVISEINAIRENSGLKPLNIDRSLSQAALLKSNNMLSRGYFEHYAFGLTPWMLMTNSGYNYQYAGENLAMDYKSSETMINAWMDSPAHRNNILGKNYEDIGVGVVKGAYTDASGVSHETVMVTQMFGKKKSPILSTASLILSRIFGIY